MRPVTNEHWQDAVDAAQLCMMFETAMLFELINKAGDVNIDLCVKLIMDGRTLGIKPSLNVQATRAFRIIPPTFLST
jgi:hypothetical protein